MAFTIPKILLKKADELEQYYKKNYPELAPLVKQCFLNTIETTVKKLDDGSYFVITGDIPAMWLRDSMAQLASYIRYANESPELTEILEGVIRKQTEFVLVDPYANAFNESANGAGHQNDNTEMGPAIWERKYEIDSLCAPIYLSWRFWNATKRTTVFDDNYKKMIKAVLKVIKTEQDHETSPYYFTRDGKRQTDTLQCEGRGTPIKNTGMTWSGFRPSDDACTYGFFIPGNLMAVQALRYAAQIVENVYADKALLKEITGLANELEDAVKKFGIIDHPKFGKMYAYETDGLGNYCLMDDANVPSLLSLPYLDYCSAEDELYRNTRKFVLSDENPFYCKGTVAEGVGSPHTPKGSVWPIGIIVRALTSTDRNEKLAQLKMLSETHAGTNFMHESFDPSNPEDFTRKWFAWANTLFAEMLIRLKEENFF